MSSPHRRRRLAPDQIAQIHKLRSAGRTQTDIQRITGISRTTISLVLSGKRREPKPPEQADESAQWQLHTGPVRRCPECGRKVHMPCIACRIEKL